MKVGLKTHRHIGKTAQHDEVAFSGLGVGDECVFLQPRNVGVSVKEYFGFAALFDGGILMNVGDGVDSAGLMASFLEALPEAQTI